MVSLKFDIKVNEEKYIWSNTYSHVKSYRVIRICFHEKAAIASLVAYKRKMKENMHNTVGICLDNF